MGTPVSLQSLDNCKAFVRSQLQSGVGIERVQPPAVTISRQVGAGGSGITGLVVEAFETLQPGVRWAHFDKNLVETILEDAKLPQEMAEFMPEDRDSTMTHVLEEILGLRPSAWKLFHHTTDTMLKLAHLGHAVLVGRAGNLITAHLPNVLHVRLVGGFERRVRRVAEVLSLAPGPAKRHVQEGDKARARYVKSHFNRDIDDPLAYHLVINTDLQPNEDIAQTIASATLHLHRRRVEEGPFALRLTPAPLSR